MKKTSILILTNLLLLSACATQGTNVRGSDSSRTISPTKLLDSSAERINIDLQSEGSTNQLTDWIENDQPSKAEISCFDAFKTCMDAKKILTSYGIPFSVAHNEDKQGNVTLIYERVVAKDCLDRTDSAGNTITGCAVSTNILHMISNHKQIIQPSLSDLPRASDFVDAEVVPVE